MKVWCLNMEVQQRGCLDVEEQGASLVEMDGDASAGDPCGGVSSLVVTWMFQRETWC